MKKKFDMIQQANLVIENYIRTKMNPVSDKPKFSWYIILMFTLSGILIIFSFINFALYVA